MKARKGIVMWFTGLSGSGKTTIAKALQARLEKEGRTVSLLDGDAVRKNHKEKLGFSREDIRENNRRIAELARDKSVTHDVVLVPVIAPYAEDRGRNRAIIGERYVEVFVDCPLSLVEARDVRGLYKKARSGAIPDFIGISHANPYERPLMPDVVIRTEEMTLEEEVNLLVRHIEIMQQRH